MEIKDIERKVENSVLEIRDLSISAYLYSENSIHFLGVRKLPNGDCIFRFSPKDCAEKLIQQYWNLQAPPIQPKTLFSSLRDMKDMIFGN